MSDPVNSSDEAVEAAAARLEAAMASPRRWGKNSAIAAFAAAVRAEAVAGERRRIREELHELAQLLPVEEAQRTSTWLARAFGTSTLAAGSVPVATSEPVQCSDDAYNCPACFPVATPPAEPATLTERYRETMAKVGDAVIRERLAAPSQPVTCEHGKTRQHYDFLTGWRCAGPVSVPKESSE